MSDAISNLGGGGLSTAYLANLATCLNYAASCAITLVGSNGRVLLRVSLFPLVVQVIMFEHGSKLTGI